ncbi:hypothetical protein GOP47_0023593 [Adiantum capillus-veneris]|uniref:OVATE domain-containing protein n=1 Tax=Adiantum capillus-veneris TaxID=13818 RepID=A0A9D4Z3I4_ADICA|nr:hypothetical protein GOP47_0023593 [Adiantum capillus-veneris]
MTWGSGVHAESRPEAEFTHLIDFSAAIYVHYPPQSARFREGFLDVEKRVERLPHPLYLKGLMLIKDKVVLSNSAEWAFRSKGLPKKKKLIAAASESSTKDLATSNASQRTIQENFSRFRSISSLGASTKKEKHKPHSRLSQVVASFGCGSTAPLGIRRRERNKPKVYSEEEDNSQAPPLDAFGKMNQKGHHRQHDEEDEIFKDCCIDPHTLTTKRWVGACRCINDVSVDKGSTRSDEALLSKRLQNELRSHVQIEAKPTMPAESKKAQNSTVNSRVLNHPVDPIAVKREISVAKKLPALITRVYEGSMSDRIVVDSRKKVNTEVKILERWSSASVRDCLVLKGNSTPADLNSAGSVSSPLKERSNATSYDESFLIASFGRRHNRPQSMTSISTLSSYDFDRASHWGSYDATNMSFGPSNGGLAWQHTNIMEEGSRDQTIRRRVVTRPSSTIFDPDVSVIAYTLSDYDSDNEDERSLLHTVSYARAWLNRNVRNDEDNNDEFDNEDEDTDGDDTDCLIDLEANAKAWALSSGDAKTYGSSSAIKHDNMGGTQYRRQRELHAAALKRKYHKEFAEKPQAIVVSSHYEDDMNTFMFPNLSDYEDDMSTKSFKFFDHIKTASKMGQQEGIRMTNRKRYMQAGDEGHDYQSFAVAKKSRNPYEDFRDSMVEMVLQKQLHKSSELEELLQSFLCLNSLEHHDLIVQAFSEVWEKVFGSISGFHKRP